YFRGQHGAAKEMRANGVGEIPTAPWAHVRAASANDVYAEFRGAKADVTGRALGDDVARAVDDDQRLLRRCKALRSFAVNVQQTAVGRLDGIGECNRLR